LALSCKVRANPLTTPYCLPVTLNRWSSPFRTYRFPVLHDLQSRVAFYILVSIIP
jgi:hypothetical protein